MMLVVALLGALLLLPAALTAVVIGGVNNAANSNPQSAALSAAYAGLADYVNSLDSNSNFQTYNAGASGTGQVYANPAFGGSGCSSGCTVANGIWEPVYSGSTATSNECYFYETTNTNGNVVVSVTGRSGPTSIASTAAHQAGTAPYCTFNSGAHYQFATIAAEYSFTLPTYSGYMYTNEYNVADPTVYGLFSGGLNTCGYYAYANNPNWNYGWVGLSFGGEIFSGTATDGFDYLVGPNGWDGYSPGVTNAFGPSQGGSFTAENQQYGSGAGYNNQDDNFWSNGDIGDGAVINSNSMCITFNLFGCSPQVNDAYAAAYLSSQAQGLTDGNMYTGSTNSVYTDGQHNGVPNMAINGFPTSIGGQSGVANQGPTSSPGAGNNYNAASSSTTDQPSGCQLMGVPFHDGYWTSYNNFNGNVSSDNYNSSQNGEMYTSDEYYLCATTNSGNYGNSYGGNSAAFSNVALYSGDPYTSNTKQVNNENDPGPSGINWNFNFFGWQVTIFALSLDPVAEVYAPDPNYANSPFTPGANAQDEYTNSGLSGSAGITIFNFYIPLGSLLQVCDFPTNFPGGTSSISHLNSQIVLPWNGPDAKSPSGPDYGLRYHEDNAKAGGCLYRGNTEFTFLSTGAATVATSGTITVSGQTVTLGNVPSSFNTPGNDGYAGSGLVAGGAGCANSGTSNAGNGLYMVIDGNAYVQGTVNGNYTVAVADPCATNVTSSDCTATDTQLQPLPGAPGSGVSTDYYYSTYGGQFVAIQPSYNINRNGSPSIAGCANGYYGTINQPGIGTIANNTYPECYSSSDTFYDSIYIIGNIIYNGCAYPYSAPNSITCGNYLGLLSQNNVVIAYPLVQAGSGGLTYYHEGATDTDANWNASQSDLTDSDNDNSVQANHDNNYDCDGCAGSAQDGDAYWQEDGWDCDGDNYWCGGGEPGCCNDPNWVNAENDWVYPGDPTDGDAGWASDGGDCGFSGDDGDGAAWICSNDNLGSNHNDTDAYWSNNDPGNSSGGGDWVNENGDADSNHSGTCGTNGDSNADNDGSWSCDWSENALSNDGDDVAAVAQNPEPTDNSAATITTINADIDAVWGAFLLDDYAQFAGADHSCYVSYFMNLPGLGNSYSELSDDSPQVSQDGTGTGNGPGNVCYSDGDSDEYALGCSSYNVTTDPGCKTLQINGSINEFWQGILTHYEAYNGGFTASGGYANVTLNYDGRFQSQVPKWMAGPGNVTWQRLALTPTSLTCPTGHVNGSGAELTAACP